MIKSSFIIMRTSHDDSLNILVNLAFDEAETSQVVQVLPRGNCKTSTGKCQARALSLFSEITNEGLIVRDVALFIISHEQNQ